MATVQEVHLAEGAHARRYLRSQNSRVISHDRNVYVRIPPGVMIRSEISTACEPSGEGGCWFILKSMTREGGVLSLRLHADDTTEVDSLEVN